jgi:hypothetical protein
MKKINDRWVDDNNNSWADDIDEATAAIYSESLTNCLNCQDCQDCQDCLNCQDCQDCQDCRYCLNCQDCQDCQDCLNCQDCQGFDSNPMRYTGQVMGSRDAQTTTYWVGTTVRVICGCFKGTLQEFKDKVIKTHGDNVYAKQYEKYIRIVETIMSMEAPE